MRHERPCGLVVPRLRMLYGGDAEARAHLLEEVHGLPKVLPLWQLHDPVRAMRRLHSVRMQPAAHRDVPAVHTETR